jgi:hypothetical protein
VELEPGTYLGTGRYVLKTPLLEMPGISSGIFFFAHRLNSKDKEGMARLSVRLVLSSRMLD